MKKKTDLTDRQPKEMYHETFFLWAGTSFGWRKHAAESNLSMVPLNVLITCIFH